MWRHSLGKEHHLDLTVPITFQQTQTLRVCHRTADQLGWCQGGQVWAAVRPGSPMGRVWEKEKRLESGRRNPRVQCVPSGGPIGRPQYLEPLSGWFMDTPNHL